MSNKQELNYKMEKSLRTFDEKDSVFARAYTPGQRWIPSTIVETTGPLSYRVETPDGKVIRRHADQLRRRRVSQQKNADLEAPEVVPEVIDESQTQPSSTVQEPQAPLRSESGNPELPLRDSASPIPPRLARQRRPPKYLENYVMEYVFNELADMHLILGECRMNCRAAARLYSERFPNRRTPHHTTFALIDRRLREYGSFKKQAINAGRPRQVPPEVEEEILNVVENEPRRSVRSVARQLNVCKTNVHRTLKQQLLKPFHLTPVQELEDLDPYARLQFCRWCSLTGRCPVQSPIIMRNCFLLISSSSSATVLDGSLMNFFPCTCLGISFQYRLYCAGFCLEDRGGFSQCETLPVSILFTIDTNIQVRQYLNEVYKGRWISRGNDAPIKWPPRSLDITPMDFFLWGTLKDKAYDTPVNSPEDLWQRILEAANEIRQIPNVFILGLTFSKRNLKSAAESRRKFLKYCESSHLRSNNNLL
ncbi:hypothetical protein NQ317_015474 [Molorchus minor]|uniref:DUF4817 domain-containing protein n=1 Tax=Molorchus minor TaxID=1323400 RepID=A0ABQ9J8I3_9CUCU|nr:hypothetical protein NQ317_015474 [Molorchus minor]